MDNTNNTLNPYSYHSLHDNYGYLLSHTPPEVLNELKLQINSLQKDFTKGTKMNHTLAGEIEHEYEILPQFQTKHFIKNLSEQLEIESQHIKTNYNPTPTLILNNLWVNFQKKHEYNPMHSHSGVFSFVIWYQIPYLSEEESNHRNFKPNKDLNTHGQFHFIHNMKTDNIFPIPIPVDKTNQGLIAIFPSSLYHIVYPFYTSDEYRITVAGNIQTI